MNTLLADVRYALRGLRKQPAFTLIALLSLGLGLGANTAIFSLVNAVLLKPLPFAQPQELVMVWEEASFANFPQNTPAAANYADWKAQNQVFEDMAALDNRGFNITGDGEPQRVAAKGITANLLPLLGVTPSLGRGFLESDDKPEANRVVLLSHRLWQSRYGGDAAILNRNIQLNGESYTVVGVLPAAFQFLDGEVELWVPMRFTQEELANRGRHYLEVVARLKPGVTLEQARADVETIMERLRRDYPDEVGKIGSVVLPLGEQLTGEVRQPFLVLLVAVGFVLLIACANIANLLLARATSRQKEIAVRVALGATRAHIVRQLLTESLLLATFGSLLGILFALWSFAFLQQLVPASLAQTAALQLDWSVLGFTFLLALATGVLFGLAPALQATRVELHEALKQGSSRGAAQGAGNRLRGAMVVVEVALALVLLVGAGLLMQTFLRLREQYANLQPGNVLTLRTALPLGKYDTHAKRVAFYEQVLERVRSLPGVTAAAYTTSVPLAMKGGTNGFFPEGLQQAQAGLSYDANHRQVTPGYFQAMGIAIKAGRHFEESDTENAQPVVIINETMARQYWAGEALGKRFKHGDPETPVPWMTIVGIAADVRQMGVEAPVKAEMYMPQRQANYAAFFAPRDLVIRASVEPHSLMSGARASIREVDAEQPVSSIRTMDDILGVETLQRRLSMTLILTFAALALLLAAIGIYGVVSYFVTQHTQEIGIRLALGAQPGDILKLVLTRGMSLTLAGVAIGVITALLLARLIASLLYGVSASDPLTFVVVAAILTAVALLACLAPALRATKVDPMVALRYE